MNNFHFQCDRKHGPVMGSLIANELTTKQIAKSLVMLVNSCVLYIKI